MPRRVLIVDDESDLSELLAYNLAKAGYDARVARDGLEGLRIIAEFNPDLVVLDLMMPGLTGQEVLTRLRADARTANLPVIVLTARKEEFDELDTLARGADDFVTKPYSIKVLEARIESVLRRANADAAPGTEPDNELRLGPIVISPDTHEARLGDTPLSLTITEYRILSALIEAGGKVLSRQTLIDRAIGAGVTITVRTIDVHVTAIRKKLGESSSMIKTVRGVGYRTVAEPAEMPGAAGNADAPAS